VPTIYCTPAELDYSSVVPPPAHWFQLDTYCRQHESRSLQLPEGFHDPSKEALIYFSLGTIGSIDVALLRRLLGLFARLPHKFVVAKGPLSEQFALPPNCWGERMLPQVAAIRQCSVVITHGGNNTVTEALAHGRPLLVLPMFFDQFDNAQRVHELGYGLRLDPYAVQEQQLAAAINSLLGDSPVRHRCEQLAQRMTATDRKSQLCEWVEALLE